MSNIFFCADLSDRVGLIVSDTVSDTVSDKVSEKGRLIEMLSSLGHVGEAVALDEQNIKQLMETLCTVIEQQTAEISAAEARVILLQWLKPETEDEWAAFDKVRESFQTPGGGPYLKRYFEPCGKSEALNRYRQYQFEAEVRRHVSLQLCTMNIRAKRHLP